MAESFADQFKSSGAVNYLELLFDHSEVGPLTVTMQRVDGLTPAQKLATAEAALSAANEKLSKPVSIWKLNNFREAPAGGIEWAKGYVVANNRAVKAISDAGFTVEE